MIERIERGDDPRLAPYAHITDPAWLRAHGRFVAEGRLVVGRLLDDPRDLLDSIVVTPAAAAGLADPLAAARCPVYVCDPRELDALSGIHFHRGCLALARRPAMLPLSSFLHARLLVGLERIADPDNIGGMFRNALAFGVDGVVLDAASADPLYRKAVRTSMAAVLRVPFTRAGDWPSACESLRNAGFTVAAFTPSPEAITLDEFAAARPGRLVLLFGSEGDGLSAAALEAADVRVSIPIDGRADSLNVVVAAGIALHHLSANRGAHARQQR